MLPDKIMQSTMLDILFENRNKNYGAYALRTSYNKTIKSSLIITTFICGCFACLMLLSHNKNILLMTEVIIPPDMKFTEIAEKPEPVEVPKPAPHKAFRQITNSTPVITKEDVATKQATVDELDNSFIGDIKTDGIIAGDNQITSPSDGNGNSTSIITKSTVPIFNDAPLNYAEVMPEFPGGIDGLRKFILKNIHQPDDLEAGEKIVVLTSFVVSKTGEIESLHIINSGRTDLDKEVLRVIHKMPLWKPGRQNGNAVAVYFKLPVTFMAAGE